MSFREYAEEANDLFVWSVKKYERLVKFYKKFRKKNYTEKRPNKTLYHYTNAAGLEGILRSKKFRLSDIRYLNDANEMVYAIELFRDQIEKKESENQEYSFFFKKLRDFSDPFDNSFNVYVSCFCEEGKLLSQWRNYGIYSIGINPNPKIRAERHPTFLGGYSEAILRKVIYDKNLQVHIIDEIIDGLFCEFKEQIKEVESNRKYLAQEYAMFFANVIMEFVLAFKDEIFEEEKEWRLIYLEMKEQEPGRNNVNFKVNGDYLVPYSEMEIITMDENKYQEYVNKKIKDGPAGISIKDHIGFCKEHGVFPLDEIRIWPCDHRVLAENSVKQFLKEQGYKDVDLIVSESMFRKNL